MKPFSSFFLLILLTAFLTGCGKPAADFLYSGENRAPATLNFENRSRNGESFLWEFGDGATSTESNPAHAFAAGGNYLVSLTATKGNRASTLRQRVVIEGPEACLVKITTEYGSMLVELSEATPLHRDNFLLLAEEGFYEDLLFHRVIDGFMIQGGDPQSRNAAPGQSLGSGGPGYTLPAEFVDTLVHIKGALAAARLGDAANPEKRSSGSQFYIVQGRQVPESNLRGLEAQKNIQYTSDQIEAFKTIGGTPFLDREYTVFGRVIDGLEVIDAIARVRRDRRDRPQQDVRMHVEIVRYFPDRQKP